MPARSPILAALLVVLFAGNALADKSAEDRAEELNDQGKSLFAEQKFEEALGKFRQALVLSAQGKYYFNVCFTLSQLQRYQEAITACEAVSSAGADDKLQSKADALLGNLRAQVQQQSGTGGGVSDGGTGSGDGGGDSGTAGGDGGTAGTGGGDGQGGSTTGAGPGGGVAPMPAAMAQAAAAPRHDYQWSLGAQIFGLNNVSIGGTADRGQLFGDGGAQFRVFGDLVLDHQRRLGAQAYLAYSLLPQRQFAQVGDLAIIDLGIAGNWHIPLTQRFYLTPLLGAHLSFQGPTDSSDVFVAVGGRAEASFDWVLDEGGRHALSAIAGVNVYSRAGGQSDLYDPETLGLDSGGVTAVVGLGYTLRFQTPLGQFPIITLE